MTDQENVQERTELEGQVPATRELKLQALAAGYSKEEVKHLSRDEVLKLLEDIADSPKQAVESGIERTMQHEPTNQQTEETGEETHGDHNTTI